MNIMVTHLAEIIIVFPAGPFFYVYVLMIHVYICAYCIYVILKLHMAQIYQFE